MNAILMASKFTILFISLLGIASVSCEKETMEEKASVQYTAVDNAKLSHLLFEENFEGPVPFIDAQNTGFGSSHSFMVVTTPVYQGKKAARFKLKSTDPMIHNGTRAEVTTVKYAREKEMWYSFAVFFPEEEFKKDSHKEAISQWFQQEDAHLGEPSQSPATSLGIRNDRFYLDTGYNRDKVCKAVTQESRKIIDLGKVEKDTWHEFVFHFVHSYKSDGLIEIWHNGSKVLTHKGGNMYNNEDLPKWKLGIYKWQWNGGGKTDTRKRVIFLDNIKVGNSKATLEEMQPEVSSEPIADEPDNDECSFSFVNAETDQVIKRFDRGALISLGALGTKKLSIRVDTRIKGVRSVKFVLKGAKSYKYVDSDPPYALFGDDKKGNYYYGSYLPPGNYLLRVYPYPEDKGRGKAMPGYSTTFTVKKY